MEPNSALQCHHIKTSGVRCGSPAVRTKRYCYYHHRSRPILLNFARECQKPVFFSLPAFEDAHAIQFTLRSVAHRLLDGTIDHKTAGLMFYALQIASSNLKQVKTETPQPEQLVVDPPPLSEIAPPTPTAEALPLNSHTRRLTHFPEPPSTEDEYRDDIKRQARELREELAFQIGDEERNSPRKKYEQPPVNDIWLPEDGPPLTIKACVSSRRRERKSTYVN